MSDLDAPRYAVLSPYVANWLMLEMATGATVTKALARNHALWLQASGFPQLAREMVVGWSQIEASAMQWREREAVQPRGQAGASAARPISVRGSDRAEIDGGGGGSFMKADITTKEAAEMLGLKSERRVGQLLARGDLDGRKVGGSWRVSRASVKRLRDARIARSAS